MSREQGEQPLTLETLVAWAEDYTRTLYDGVEVRHRSCGIALAQTFGCETAPYQALRRGGLTGAGQCGAIKAGELILGEIFGDPDPAGGVTPRLRSAVTRYQELWQETLALTPRDIVCDDLTGRFDDFKGLDRHAFCTRLSERVAGCVARALLEHGADVTVKPLPES